MKHKLSITTLLFAFFMLAQFIGLFVVYSYLDPVLFKQGEIKFDDLPIGERPPLEEETSYIPIILAILLGTGLLLVMIKFNWTWLWKAWFLLAVVVALTMAFGAWLPAGISFILASLIGLWKIFKPNFWVQNLSELFIYSGLAVIFVPVLNLFSVSVLLVLIGIYDAYAVWKSKHMVKLAKSQASAKVFAGLYIPYTLGKKVVKSKKKLSKGVRKKLVEVRTAVLGGGDIGFPLIFAGVVMKEMGLWQSLAIPLFSGLGLWLLLIKGKEKKFYPAMPFIGAGCFVGLLVVWLIGLI